MLINRKLSVFLLLFILWIAGCSSTPSETVIVKQTVISEMPVNGKVTEAAEIMPEPTATATAEPTATATTEPTATATVEPTNTPENTEMEPPDKILFVGNSLTFYNKGVDYHMEQLAGSANPPMVIEADSVVQGGATLKFLWGFTSLHDKIGEGDYDVVVLQEDIPETRVALFYEYTRKFVTEIREAGTEPVLFMAWSYERLGQTTMEEIAQAHRSIATELGVDVAPVGLAWQRAMEERPDLDMYDSDREHPSIYGTYLAANVIYATVFGKSPVGLTYLPSERGGVTEEEAAILQRIAWETVQEYQAQE